MEEEMKIVDQFLKECEEEILKALESGELQAFMSQTVLSSKMTDEVPSLEAKSLEGISLPTDIPQFREIKPPPADRFRKK